MWEIEISEKAKKICKEYYTYECDDNCPLRSPCKTNFIPSEENINENTKRINELAEKISMSCKDCTWYYKEHCANGESEYCTEPVREDDTCKEFEN